MYRIKNKQKNKHRFARKSFVLFFCGLVAIIGLAVLADAKNVIDLPLFPDNKPSATTPGTINYDPPTKEEVSETQNFKDNLSSDKPASQAQSTPTQANGKKSVKPVISSWGFESPNLQASGFIPGIIESGGTCTLTANKNGTDVTSSITGTENAQNVSCGLIKINRDKLTAGIWKITLTYSSTVYEGTSDPQTQEVK